MRTFMWAVVVASTVSFPAFAQSFEATPVPAANNVGSCKNGDAGFTKKWTVKASGDSAILTTSSGTSLNLKKIADGIYETTATIGGGSFVFTAVTREGMRSIKVLSKQFGCVWEGKA